MALVGEPEDRVGLRHTVQVEAFAVRKPPQTPRTAWLPYGKSVTPHPTARVDARGTWVLQPDNDVRNRPVVCRRRAI